MLKSCPRVFVLASQGPYLTVISSSMMVDFHRFTEWLKVEGSARSLLVKTTGAGCPVLSGQLLKCLKNLFKDRDFTVSLGSLCQCLVTLTVKQDFLVLRRNLLSCSVCPLSLVPSLGTPRKSLALSCLRPPLEFLWNC